jgi:hypothetical protein
VLALAGVTVAAGLTACATSEPVSENVQASLLTALESSADINNATQLARAACMEALGFNYEYAVEVDTAVGANPLGLANLNDDETSARENGFTLAVRQTSLGEAEEKEDPATQQALHGDEDDQATLTLTSGAVVTTAAGGCIGESLTAVYGSPINYLKLSNLPNEVLAAGPSLESLDMQPVWEKYGPCMSEHGYGELKNLGDTFAYVEAKYVETRDFGSAPSAEEVSLAVADATCQRESEVREFLIESFMEQAAPWMKANQALILEMSELRGNALKNAKAIVEG